MKAILFQGERMWLLSKRNKPQASQLEDFLASLQVATAYNCKEKIANKSENIQPPQTHGTSPSNCCKKIKSFTKYELFHSAIVVILRNENKPKILIILIVHETKHVSFDFRQSIASYNYLFAIFHDIHTVLLIITSTNERKGSFAEM